MSTQITTAFSQQFSANVQLLSQQMGSILRGAISEEAVTGEKAFFDQVGSAAAVKRTSRHGDTPTGRDTPFRRMVTMDSYEWADLIDDADKVRMLIDPTAPMLVQLLLQWVVLWMMPSSKQQQAQPRLASLAAPAQPCCPANQIANGSADLTLAKLIEAKKILDLGSVDPSIPRHIAVGPDQIEALLNSTTVTSQRLQYGQSSGSG